MSFMMMITVRMIDDINLVDNNERKKKGDDSDGYKAVFP